MPKFGSSARPDWSLAIVIGAGGIGMAAARRLSQRRRVLIVDIDEAKATRAAATLSEEGGDASWMACDITNRRAVAALSAKVAELGGFQALAHVAGLSPSMGDFRAIMAVNLGGAVSLAEQLLPHASAGAAAVLVSSLAAHHYRPPAAVEDLLRQPGDPDIVEKLIDALGPEHATPQAAYQISKYALMAYCRRNAARWGERGARIVSLSPGLIASPMGAREFENSPTKIKLFERIPLKREGTMLEIADAIEFLLSDRASYISGTDLLVDGGLAGTLGN